MSRSQQAVQERYRRALDALTQKLQQDRTVLATIVYGSYSYDQVWEKSDIDLWIVMADDPKVQIEGIVLRHPLRMWAGVPLSGISLCR